MSRFARFGFDLLVVFNVVAQGTAVLVFMLGQRGASAAPVAGGAVVALFLLVYFYARWMFSVLKRRHVLAVILLKELGVIVLVGLAVGLVLLFRSLFG